MAAVDNRAMQRRRVVQAAGAWALAAGMAPRSARAATWFPQGRPGVLARQAVQLLRAAASQGLDPRDYAAEALAHAVDQAAGEGTSQATRLAQLDAALDAAMQRYLRDLHAGRIDPRGLHPHHAMPPQDHFDAQATLQRARDRGDLATAVREAVPPLAQYERLREALTAQRTLVGHPAWQQALPPLPAGRAAGKLAPGQPWTGTALLRQRLQALGDLQPDAPAADTSYDGALVGAVQAFQRRHGLDGDGVVGAATWRALQVAPALRVRQIELALERLRWTPLLAHVRTIVVNIPEFVLRAYELQDGRIAVQRTMKVVVGKALDTRTPLISAELRQVEFSPFWNVPLSIARGEVVPQLRRQPALWTREGYEFVDARGQVDTALSPAKLEAVLAGRLRIRQRPGPRNPLGDIKFVFPNQEQIYLHHTPSTRLFERERRDFSHGCIRVEKPVELATFVLHGMAGWSETRIREAMGRGTSATLAVAEPVRVLIAYATALVKDGRIHFFDDVYGLDALLDAALQRESRLRPPLMP